MYKYKKYTINSLTILYIVLTIIELVKYLFTDSNIYGLIYLLVTFFIMFLLVPICLNYNKYYSSARISKLILVIIIGFLTSYVLNIIVFNSINYMDDSKIFKESIFIIKNILKPIIYSFLIIFTLLEFKLDKIIMRKMPKNKVHLHR